MRNINHETNFLTEPKFHQEHEQHREIMEKLIKYI